MPYGLELSAYKERNTTSKITVTYSSKPYNKSHDSQSHSCHRFCSYRCSQFPPHRHRSPPKGLHPSKHPQRTPHAAVFEISPVLPTSNQSSLPAPQPSSIADIAVVHSISCAHLDYAVHLNTTHLPSENTIAAQDQGDAPPTCLPPRKPKPKARGVAGGELPYKSPRTCSSKFRSCKDLIKEGTYGGESHPQ